MQNCNEPSAFFVNSIRAPHGEEEAFMAPTSNSSSIYYFTNNYSWGLWWYSPFCTSSMPGSSGIKCTSPSFWFGGTYFGSCPGNTLRYLCSKSCSGPRCFLVTPSKWGTALSWRSFSLYKTSCRNSTGLLDVFNWLSYFTGTAILYATQKFIIYYHYIRRKFLTNALLLRIIFYAQFTPMYKVHVAVSSSHSTYSSHTSTVVY